MYHAHLILDLINPITLASSTIMKLHYAVLSSFLLLPLPYAHIIFLSTLSSNTLSLGSYLNVRGQLPHF